MIKKILQLKNISNFTSLSQDVDFIYGESENCNIVFGFNGSGKTTLSNAISLFGDTSFISDEEKAVILDDIKTDETAVVELELQGKSKVKVSPTKQSNSKNIYVFNSNFITSHVFDGTIGRMRRFANISGEIINEKIKKAGEKITALEVEAKSLEATVENLDGTLNTLNKTHSANFNKMLTDKNKRLTKPSLNKANLPTETLEKLMSKLPILSSEYELSKKQFELESDLIELEQLVFMQSDLDLSVVNNALGRSIQQLSKSYLEGKINEVRNLFDESVEKENVNKWFAFTKNILDNGKNRGLKKCPVCDTDISNRVDSILLDFDEYFDKSYEALVQDLVEHANKIQAAIDMMQKSEINSRSLKGLWEKYRTHLSEMSFDFFDFSAVINELNSIRNACETKTGDILFKQQISLTTINAFASANVAINAFGTLRDKVKTSLESKKLNTGKIEDDIRSTYEKIVLLEFDQNGKGGNFKNYQQIQKKLSAITTSDPKDSHGILYHRNIRREELKKIKIESKSISKYLKQMGIDHFMVDINESAENENIIIRYKTASADKTALRNSLSDGEKTSLAFAYFLSKFENERDTDEKKKNSVIVIDDPISSLDENRLYSTAYLIRDCFKSSKQLIVLSHNFLFLKFFFTAYSKRANCLFLDGEKITELPEEMQNFESPYFYMLRSIIQYATDTSSSGYNSAKKFLPNYIRRVLETFFSFKFAKIVNGSGSKRSAGLTDFDDVVDEMDFDDSFKCEVKSMVAGIAKISNQHSHGNAQLTEENCYISEIELIALAKNAISIIDMLDSTHKVRVERFSSSLEPEGIR